MAALNMSLKSRGSIPLLVGLAIILATLLAIFGIFRLVGAQRDFELDRWQARLAATTQSMSEAARGWLETRQAALDAAAANPTVQIYLSELALAGFDAGQIVANETKRGFVDSYIAALTRRAPFDDGAGVALVAGSHMLVTSSEGFAPEIANFEPLMAAGGGAAMSDENGRAVMRMAAPVAAMMPGAAAAGFVLVGVPMDDVLLAQLEARNGFASGFALLDVEASGISVLDAQGWRVLTPAAASDADLLAAAREPGHLVTGDEFLLLAAPVTGTSWVTVSMIDRETALGGVQERMQALLLSLLFALLAVIAVVLAAFAINRVSEEAKAKERKAKFYWGLTDLLLDAIDQRDPGAAAHSRRVSALSAELMRAQAARPGETETAEIAGALLNVGKLFVPSNVLTKSGALDPEERGQFSSGSEKWLDLLSKVPFDLPICDVLAEAHGLMQGRLALEEARFQAARAIVVANGYVALVSPRTYRDPKSADDAIALLANSRGMDTQIIRALTIMQAAH